MTRPMGKDAVENIVLKNNDIEPTGAIALSGSSTVPNGGFASLGGINFIPEQ